MVVLQAEEITKLDQGFTLKMTMTASKQMQQYGLFIREIINAVKQKPAKVDPESGNRIVRIGKIHIIFRAEPKLLTIISLIDTSSLVSHVAQ